MKKKITLLMALVVILMCGITVHAEDYSISQNKATINVGDTIDLDVSGTDKVPVWMSYNANIARVNQKGEVTALKPGKALIRVRAGSEYKTCAITVVDSNIKLNKTNAAIYHGGTSVNTAQLKASVKGAYKSIEWYSSDTSVATVDEKGKVTSVSEGTAVITADANGKTASCIVAVKESGILLDIDSMQLSTKGAGSSIKVTPTIIGSKKSVEWTTSDKAIATVSGGKVTGKKTGTATITATANGVSSSCSVSVMEGLISISEEKVLLYSNAEKPETKQLKTNAEKQDAVIWTSSDSSVVTVSDKGLVTAIGAGTAVVSAECNGNIDICEVIVKETSIDIEETSVNLKTKGADKTYTLAKKVVGRKNTVKWVTSDKNVATVSNGKITAKKAGTATITATANGVSDTVVVNVADFTPSIKLNQRQYVLYTGKGNTTTLKAVVDGASKSVTWESTDTAVATVTNKGKITAVGEGTAIITATANGVSDTCLVTVKESAVRLSSSYLKMSKGGTAKLAVDITGTSQTVKWSSTNSKAVTVKNGVITAKKDGEADIKATANGVTSICHVLVDSSGCNHIYDNGVVTKDATCADTGIITYTCTICGDDYNVDTAATAHKYEDRVVEPTCVESGYTQHTCNICGDFYTDNILEAKGHVYGEWEIEKEATTEETGLKSRTCRVCGDRQQEELPIIPEGHEHKYIDTVISPTCTQAGYTIHICECGAFLPNDNYTDALGHSYGEWKVVTEPTETTTGTKVRTCERCGEKETDTIPVTTHVHDYATVNTVKPTCTEQGYTTYTCVCGDSYTDNYTDALGHSYGEWKVVTEPTETTTGTKERTCERCGEKETDTIPVTTHVHDYATVNTVKPTCTEQGYTTYTCACGDSYTDNYTDALGHNYGEWKVVKEPTETTTGTKERTCERCDRKETETIPVTTHVHNYTEHVIEPTCTEQGYTTYTCTCGYSYKDNYTDALGHSYGEWKVILEPTETTMGCKQRTCERCSKKESVSIPVKQHQHDYVAVNIVEPTCTMGGYTEYACSTCDETYTGDFIQALGHTLSDWFISGSCDPEIDGIVKGTEYNKCTVCEAILESHDINISHQYEWIITKESTCQEEGEKEYKCAVCGRINRTLAIHKLSHDYTEWEITKEPADGAHTTVSDFGSRKRNCTVCGELREENIINIDLGDGETKQLYGVFFDDMAYETFGLVNELRASVGADELRWFDNFEGIGRIRAAEISYLYGHTRPNGGKAAYITESGISLALGENIWGGYDVCSAKIAVDGWAESSGHYANMVNTKYINYYCGCFASYDDNDKLWYNWVQLFWGNKSSGTTTHVHNYQVKYIEEPTNCSDGYTVYVCGVCGSTKKDDYVPMTGDGEHEWDYYNITLYYDDYYAVYCKVCGCYTPLTMDEILKYRETDIKIKEVIDNIITDDMNDVEKILAVNNWICLNCYYDYDTYHKNENYDHDSYTAYGAICKGKAVCDGYAKAFEEFMDVLGIECRHVVSSSMNHAWNQVKLDDGWYWIDCTWNDDDSGDFFKNTYFLKTGQRAEDEYGGTVCDGTKWVDGGLLLFGKYKVSDASELNSVYKLQKENDALYFLFDSKADCEKMWSIPSEYWKKYEEAMPSYIIRFTDTSDNTEKYLIFIRNSDKVRALFEERMKASGECDEEGTEVETGEGTEVETGTEGGTEVETEDGTEVETEVETEEETNVETEENTDNESETDESVLDENTDTVDESPAVETIGETEIAEDKSA